MCRGTFQDNATYHKDGDVWAWFDANRHWLEVHQLPPYSPELNPTERLWGHTRRTGTHNRYFPDEKELSGTLSRVFGEMQSYPELIPICNLFYNQYVPLFIRVCIDRFMIPRGTMSPYNGADGEAAWLCDWPPFLVARI
jgi:hypothetical protein